MLLKLQSIFSRVKKKNSKHLGHTRQCQTQFYSLHICECDLFSELNGKSFVSYTVRAKQS